MARPAVPVQLQAQATAERQMEGQTGRAASNQGQVQRRPWSPRAGLEPAQRGPVGIMANVLAQVRPRTGLEPAAAPVHAVELGPLPQPRLPLSPQLPSQQAGRPALHGNAPRRGLQHLDVEGRYIGNSPAGGRGFGQAQLHTSSPSGPGARLYGRPGSPRTNQDRQRGSAGPPDGCAGDPLASSNPDRLPRQGMDPGHAPPPCQHLGGR